MFFSLFNSRFSKQEYVHKFKLLCARMPQTLVRLHIYIHWCKLSQGQDDHENIKNVFKVKISTFTVYKMYTKFIHRNIPNGQHG